MPYTKTTWNAGAAPGISAANLNHLETQYDAAAADLASHKAAGGSEHPAVTASVNGFMVATDKTKLDGATSAATASTLVLRDASGRAKVAAPSAADDIAQKAQADAVQTNLDAKMNATTGHKHTGAAGDAPILYAGFPLQPISAWGGGNPPHFERDGKLYRISYSGTYLTLHERTSWSASETQKWSVNVGISFVGFYTYDPVQDVIIYSYNDIGGGTFYIRAVSPVDGGSNVQKTSASNEGYPLVQRAAYNNKYWISRSDVLPLGSIKRYNGSTWSNTSISVSHQSSEILGVVSNRNVGRVGVYSGGSTTYLYDHYGGGRFAYLVDETATLVASASGLEYGDQFLMFGTNYAVHHADGYIGNSAICLRKTMATLLYMGASSVFAIDTVGNKVYEIPYTLLAQAPYFVS